MNASPKRRERLAAALKRNVARRKEAAFGPKGSAPTTADSADVLNTQAEGTTHSGEGGQHVAR